MKKANWHPLHHIFFWIGISLIASAIIAFALWQRDIHISQQHSASYVETLRTLIPEPVNAFPEERSNNEMPALCIDGTDFIGILEMPIHGTSLPVCADWGLRFRYPSCFSGSIYNKTIQIGGTSQKGQFDFYREISVGDNIFFTDMSGNRYTYSITDIRYEKHADQTTLHRKESAFTLFIKNVYAFEYIIVFCDVLK